MRAVDKFPKMNCEQVIRAAAARLGQANVEKPIYEARLLVAHGLGWSVERCIADARELIDANERQAIDEMVARRVRNEPLQYIIGNWSFYGRKFKCDTRALIMRPETELLVHYAVEFLRESEIPNPEIIDIGTGSGVLAISIKLECPSARVVGIDVSKEALELARENAHLLDAEVEFVARDGLQPPASKDVYDIVLSNPPYVPTERLASLQPELKFEPHMALDGGDDGMSVLEPLLRALPHYLRGEGGLALLEIDPCVSEACDQLANDIYPGARVKIERDFNGLERVLTIRT